MRRGDGMRLWSAIVMICVTCAGAGCGGSLPGTDLPMARTVSPALEFPELRDYRGEIDCKMKQSGFDEAKLGELARNLQIDFIFLGDYAKGAASDFGIAGFTEQVLFIPGASFRIGNRGAEIVAMNLLHPIDAGRAPGDIIGQIHEQGGLALAANPAAFTSPDEYSLADAIEIYNQRSAWDARSSWSRYLRAVFSTGGRLFTGLDLRPDANLAIYDRMASGARVAMTAGVGAAPEMPVLGTKVGTYEQIFQVFTTHILAHERQTDPIVDALRHGHAYVSFDLLGYVENFAFFAQSGERKVMMGDEVAIAPGLKLRVEMAAVADRIVILDNGAEVASAENVANFEYAPAGAGAYRVEAYREGCPWIYSNPIYVR
jgi:hypothetical protein